MEDSSAAYPLWSPSPDEVVRSLQRDVAALEQRFGADLVSVVLFGSRARGDAKPGSDIDVLVVVRGLPGALRRRHALP
jgi:predicted nucleotidyltransferase